MNENTPSTAEDISEGPTHIADAKGPDEQDSADHNTVDAVVRAILCDVLGLNPVEVAKFDADTGLFGHLPELDSMAVAGLLTEMEDRLDIVIEDDEIDGEMLEDFGGLLAFAEMKANEA